MSLLLNILSRLVISFLARSKCLLISWLQSLSAVILEIKRKKSFTVSVISPSICHGMMGLDAMIFVFWMLSFKPVFSLSPFTFIRRLYSSSSLSAIRVVCRISEFIDISPGNLDPACASSSLAFCMMYSAYKLNNQGDSIQLWHTPSQFGISQSFVPCSVLTIASWPAYRFLRR